MAFEEVLPLPDDEVEEIRELIYEILKEFPAGITSTFLEQKYTERYVDKEEFELKDVSTFTMLYLVQTKSPSIRPDAVQLQLQLSTERSNGVKTSHDEDSVTSPNVVPFNSAEFEPIPLSSLPQPTGDPLLIKLISGIDPDAIYFRLTTWLPYCEYLYAALSRLPSAEQFEPKIGEILATKVNERWERVEMVRPSSADSNYWVVWAVDEGYFHAVHRNQLRPLTKAVTAFNKIFLAKCKLDIDRPRPVQNGKTMERHNIWSPAVQHFVGKSLLKAAMRSDCRVEIVPTNDGWEYLEAEQIPTCTAKLLIDGADFAKQMELMGFVE
uniref:Tudor domain-containing protein n=1 Tax=Globodera rostochiensis TaxID=31243 RepID=A0A914HTT1_GLORO